MSDPISDLTSIIEEAAGGPAAASGDAGSVTQQPLPDLLAVREKLAANSGAGKPRRGIRFTKLVPPGAD